MRKPLVSLCAPVLAALLATGSSARAENFPWSYSATASTTITTSPLPNASSVTFAGASGVAGGNSGIIIFNLTASSSQDPGTADTFNAVPFDLKLTINDATSLSSTDAKAVKSGSVDISGTFSATDVSKNQMTPGAITFNGTTNNDGSVTIPPTLVLGGSDVKFRDYQVKIISATEPGVPNQTNAPGAILALVTVTSDPNATGGNGGSGDGGGSGGGGGGGGGGGSGQGGGGVSDTPEPSTLLLAGLGLPVFLARRRKARA